MNTAYRWLLGDTPREERPRFSMVSNNFRNRFTEESVDKIFV